MGFTLRTLAADIKFPEAVSLNALEHALPQATIDAVIADLGVTEARTRKLPAGLTLLLCIAMGLFTNTALTHWSQVKPLPALSNRAGRVMGRVCVHV